MTKHTPGPWYAVNHFLTVKDQTGEIICHVRSGGNLSADAHLIAAAPDLLAEMKRLRLAYVNLLEIGRDRIIAFGGSCDPVDVMEAGDPSLRSAAVCIAKAEGRV